MPTARAWLSTCVMNNKIYAIGGSAYVGQKEIVYRAVEEYDPTTDTWTKRTDMPTARTGLTTDVVNGKIYAVGGSVSWDNFNLAFSKVEIYDPIMDRWEMGLDMPTARAWLSSGAVNEKIYAIGGAIPGLVSLAVVEEYIPEGWPFQQSVSSLSPQDKLPTTWGEIKSR